MLLWQLCMIVFFKKLLLLCFFTWTMVIACGQVKFTASISPGQIFKDEYATLRLEVHNSNNIHQIIPPSLKNFNIVSGPNQESGMSNVNGVTKQYIALNYIVQPKQTGNIVIEAASANIAGKWYKSSSLKLSVKKSNGSGNSANNAYPNPLTGMDPFTAAAPSKEFNDFILKKGELVQNKVNNCMQLRLQTSKTSCFVGEPIVATYKLFTRLKSESKLSKSPSFNGFSVIDLQQPDETDFSREKIKDREYNVYTVRKVQLYPLQDGAIELESATLDNNIQFLKADALAGSNNLNSFINGYSLGPDAIVTQMVSLSNKPLTITVKPLPENGRPAGFKGAVGKFEMTAALEKNNFNSDETGKLTITISGSGNLQLVTAPEINWPRSIESFEPKVEDDLELMNVPVSGKKTFVYPFTADLPGTYQLHAAEFSYFDPGAATYKTIKIAPITFTVKKGLNTPLYTADNIIRKAPASFSKRMFTNRGWIVAGIALMIISGLIFWIKGERTSTTAKDTVRLATAVQAIEIPQPAISAPSDFTFQNPLAKTEACLNTTDCTQFYTLLYIEMKAWLANRFMLNLKDIHPANIALALDKAGIENSVALQLQQLLQEIEWQLYTPFERNDAMGEFYSRSQTLLQQINNYQAATL